MGWTAKFDHLKQGKIPFLSVKITRYPGIQKAVTNPKEQTATVAPKAEDSGQNPRYPNEPMAHKEPNPVASFLTLVTDRIFLAITWSAMKLRINPKLAHPIQLMPRITLI